MVMDFGWKKKAEKLRMIIVSAAHRYAKDLPPGLEKALAIYRRVVAEGGTRGDLVQELEAIRGQHSNDVMPLWEPATIYGWQFQATMYLRDGELWWLVHASRKNENVPSEKEMTFLDKVLDHLGAEPSRHAIISPRSSPPDEDPVPFGWWTWKNRSQLFDIQVNEHAPRDRDKMRIVPLGSRETDGYRSLPLDEDER